MTLTYIAAAWVAGITLAAFLSVPTAFWFLLFALAIGYLVIWWRDLNLRLFHFILLALTLGAIRYQLALPNQSGLALAQFNDRGPASLIGYVSEEPDRRDTYLDLRIDVTKIKVGGEWQDIQGNAIIQAPRDTPALYGDEVQVDATPGSPPDGADFSYRDFLARESVFTSVSYASVYVLSHDHGNPFWAHLLEFKAYALHSVNTLLPEPAASLLSGILLGNDRGIPHSLKDAFSITNTTHIIAISGFNIAILAMFLGQFARRLFASRPRLADAFVILALISYSLLVGAGPSVVRATIMGILGIIAIRAGRQAFALNSLAFAALLMTLLNPYALWDVGFQLSFLATIGLLVYVEPMNKRLTLILQAVAGSRRKAILSFLSDSFVVSVSAWIATTPLLIAIFHRFSLIGLVTNFLILPAQPPIMILGGLATLIQTCAEALAAVPFLTEIMGGVAQVLGWGAFVFLQYTILVVGWTAKVPYASVQLPYLDWAVVSLIYLLLFLGAHLSPRRLAGFVLSRPSWIVGFVACSVVLIWTGTLASPDPRTHVQFIATDGGDAIYIRGAKDSRILIDGSSEPSALLAHLGEQMPFWDRRLDLIVATHLDEQNLASLNAVLERYTVGHALSVSSADDTSASYKKWVELLKEHGVIRTEACSGTHLQAEEVVLDTIYPFHVGKSANAALNIAIGNHRLLIAPELHMQDLHTLVDSDAKITADIAMLPSEIDEEFLHHVAPQTVIMFVGAGSREQPRLETLKLLSGINILRTDERGTIEVVVDGEEVSVVSEQ